MTTNNVTKKVHAYDIRGSQGAVELGTSTDAIYDIAMFAGEQQPAMSC